MSSLKEKKNQKKLSVLIEKCCALVIETRKKLDIIASPCTENFFLLRYRYAFNEECLEYTICLNLNYIDLVYPAIEEVN